MSIDGLEGQNCYTHMRAEPCVSCERESSKRRIKALNAKVKKLEAELAALKPSKKR